ncbi:MAG: STAS domain-containing protein [Lachnospiraceae bacterium]|jgi:anti-sigma B factor antagonist|nr:STAS domain-containing protein [Lachnospiraceae bacterium]MBQ6319341.1 STAS domain-containing protein [Lachnospiraceae bacterium]MBR1450819.1 STAS domain-containing protein [Lachnospiraceae bacterium]
MNIKKEQNGSELNIAVEGRLDTITAPELDAELTTALNGIEKLVFDFSELEYISSAGLRVLLSAQKVMTKQGGMVIRNVKPEIMEIFEVTGFVDILDIEN